MRPRITPSDYERVARALRCEPAAIRAVAEVESAGGGFLPDGRPKILFERHIFSRLTERRFDLRAPDLSDRDPGGYEGNAAEYLRLYRAAQLDADAAVQSASWGMFQIMGFNWRACGEKSLLGFVLAMHNSEPAQLNLFAGFIASTGLDEPLRERDWRRFAEGYNGPAQRGYDSRIADAYTRHSRG